MLETIENRFQGRDYLVELGAPEFTSICPLTDAPDFGELTIRYVPDTKLFELKSLRDYLTSFRERKIFQEEVVNEVARAARRRRCAAIRRGRGRVRRARRHDDPGRRQLRSAAGSWISG